MRILVVGSGGREDALCWKLAQSPEVERVFCAPGNPGTARHASNVPFSDIESLASWATNAQIDLTVVGPEGYLAAGLADVFCGRGLAVFGPSQSAARIETSKLYAKEIMSRAGVPTAAFRAFESASEACDYLSSAAYPVVVKADGLAGGKGAVTCADRSAAEKAVAMLLGSPFSGRRVLIEEFMSGREASVFAVCDGQKALLMIPARDHKRVGDGDTGPNTGGMGAFAPVPDAPDDLCTFTRRMIIEPVLHEMRRAGHPFVGLLYAGLMLTDQGPRVVEFNARFGDPETQVLLPLLESDLAPVLLAAARGDLAGVELTWKNGAAAGVVLASKGYPAAVQQHGLPISGLNRLAGSGHLVFHSGTALSESGLITNGGRILTVVGMGDDLRQAVSEVYSGMECIEVDGAFYRRDIAGVSLERA